MAKEEGTKEEESFETLDEAFSAQADKDDQENPTAEHVADEELDKLEAEPTEEKPAEQPPEPPGEPEETEKPEESWKDLGLEQFEGKSPQEIAALVKQLQEEKEWRDRLYGQQSNELGELRKKVAEREKPKEEPKPTSLIDALPELTEGQLHDFEIEFAKSPIKAIFKYGGEQLKQHLIQEMQPSFKEQVEETVKQHYASQSDAMEQRHLLQTHPDAMEYVGAINVFDKPEYLGDQRRSYEDLYQLAKLGKSNEPLYSKVYAWMRKHPQMDFTEAKKFAELEMHSPEAAEKKRAEIKKNIEKAGTHTSYKASKSVSKPAKVHESIDDAFDSVKDDD